MEQQQQHHVLRAVCAMASFLFLRPHRAACHAFARQRLWSQMQASGLFSALVWFLVSSVFPPPALDILIFRCSAFLVLLLLGFNLRSTTTAAAHGLIDTT